MADHEATVQRTPPVTGPEPAPPPPTGLPDTVVAQDEARAPSWRFRVQRAWRNWIRPAWYPAAAYFLSRVLALLAVATTGAMQDDGDLGRLVRVWDGGWYTIVATQGYPHTVPAVNGHAIQSALAFFPGYPMVMRAMTRVTGLESYIVGPLIAGVGGLVAAIGVWAIARRLLGDAVARRSALLFCFFPGAFVFSFMYSEGLMLAFVVFALLAVMERRWVIAGLLGAAATSVRPNALLLVLCFTWAAVAAIRERREWRALIAPILAPLGTLAYFAWQGHRVGDYLFWFRVEDEGWKQRFDFGQNTVNKFLWLVNDYSGPTAQAVLGIGLILMVVLLVFLWRWKPPAVLTIWTIGVLFLAVTSESQGARPRYLLTAFPLIIALAREVEGETFRWVLATSAALMMLMTVLVAHPLTLEP
jgi:hypothetical protein